MNKKTLFTFILILAFGLSIRLINFGSNPVSLYWDEVAMAIDAQSIAKTGLDQHGKFFLQPLFKSYGDYKAPIYIYFIALLAKLFPWSDSLVRLPSLLSYLGTSVCLFFTIYLLTKKNKLSLWACFSLAIMPWSIHFSRVGFESHLSLFWLSLSIFSLTKASLERKPIYYIISALSIIFGVYTYIVLRIIGPIIFIALHFYLNKNNLKHNLKVFFFSLVLLAVSIFFLVSSPMYQDSQQYRLSNDNLLNSTQYIQQSVENLQFNPDNFTNRLVHHRYWYLAKNYLANYFTHFQPMFLGINGDTNLRHHSGYGGMLLLPQFIFLFALPFLINRFKTPANFIYLFLAFISPLIASLVNEVPHASRSIYLILPLSYFIGLALDNLKSKPIKFFLVLSLLFNLTLYLYDYHFYYPDRSQDEWINQYKQTFIYLNQSNLDGVDDLYITDQYYQPNLYANHYLEQDKLNSVKIHYTLPDNCPQVAWCIVPIDWNNQSHQIIYTIPGTNLAIKQSQSASL